MLACLGAGGEHPGLNGWQAWQNIPENGTGDGDGRARQRPVVPPFLVFL